MSRENLPARIEQKASALVEHIRQQSARLKEALPAILPPEKVATLLRLIVYKTPRLAECDGESVILSVIQAAECGLALDPAKGEAWLVPRYNKDTKSLECQFQPGYQGLARLAREAGNLRYLTAERVHEADTFKVWRDPDWHIEHAPNFSGDRGACTHVYAAAKIPTGEILLEVMTTADIEAIHEHSEGFKYAQRERKDEFGPWVTNWGEMARKSVARRLCKWLPKSPALDLALSAHDSAFDYESPTATTAPALPKPANNSGYATGMYASPEQTRAYLDAIEAWLGKQNDRWLDTWQDRAGEFPKALQEFMNIHQADGHLLKWCVETGRLDRSIVPEEAKIRQLGRYVAIVFHRSTADRREVGKEMERYAAEHWQRKTESLYRLHPELDPDAAPQTSPASEDDGDPDVDLPAEFRDESDAGARG